MKTQQTLAQQIGEAIRKARTAANMSLRELAEEASKLLPDNQKIYSPDLSNFEKRGETLTNINKIEAVLAVLGRQLTISEKKTLLISVK